MALPPAGDRHRRGGALPVMQQVRDEARRRKVDLVVLPTARAIGALAEAGAHTNAILHLTCSACRRGICGPSKPAPRRRAGAGAMIFALAAARHFEAPEQKASWPA